MADHGVLVEKDPFGNLLRNARWKRNITIKEMAARLDIPATSLHYLEQSMNGYSNPKFAVAVKIADRLDEPLERLQPFNDYPHHDPPEVVEGAGLSFKAQYLREKRNLTITELAKRSGLSVKTITQLERDQVKQPAFIPMAALADALSVKLDYFREQ